MGRRVGRKIEASVIMEINLEMLPDVPKYYRLAPEQAATLTQAGILESPHTF